MRIYTVFFSNGSSAKYNSLEELLNAIKDIEFDYVTVYEYSFPMKMYITKIVTTRIKHMLDDLSA